MQVSEEQIIQRLDRIDQKLNEHDQRFERIDAKLEKHDRNFDDHDQKLDKLITIAVDHGERLSRIEETMMTKTDYRHMLGLLEDIATRIKRIEEDHLFSIEWIKRLQDQADRQEREIQAIKLKLQMA